MSTLKYKNVCDTLCTKINERLYQENKNTRVITMTGMIDYDLLVEYLRIILKDSVYCEDGELKIRNKLKYDIYNLLSEVDKRWVRELEKELEFNEVRK